MNGHSYEVLFKITAIELIESTVLSKTFFALQTLEISLNCYGAYYTGTVVSKYYDTRTNKFWHIKTNK